MDKALRFADTYEWVNEIANKTIIELKRTSSILEELHSRFFEKYSISNTKFNLLVILFKASESGLILSEIGDQLLVTKANITGLVDRLEKQGLVKRIRDDIDRRKIMAVITQKGKNFIVEVIGEYKEWSKNLMTALDEEEKKQLITMLRKAQQAFAGSL